MGLTAYRNALDALERALRETFGARLRCLVVYGRHAVSGATYLFESPVEDGHEEPPVNTLALVDHVTMTDLSALALRNREWKRQGLAVPLVLAEDEFRRSLDVFPLEYGNIIDHHLVLAGEDPFAGLRILEADLRRACELQAKSHLIHLREGFLEAAGERTAVARLIAASAGSFAPALANVARLQGSVPATQEDLAQMVEAGLGVPASVLRQVLSLTDGRSLDANGADALFPRYLDACERLWKFVDGWHR